MGMYTEEQQFEAYMQYMNDFSNYDESGNLKAYDQLTAEEQAALPPALKEYFGISAGAAGAVGEDSHAPDDAALGYAADQRKTDPADEASENAMDALWETDPIEDTDRKVEDPVDEYDNFVDCDRIIDPMEAYELTQERLMEIRLAYESDFNNFNALTGELKTLQDYTEDELSLMAIRDPELYVYLKITYGGENKEEKDDEDAGTEPEGIDQIEVEDEPRISAQAYPSEPVKTEEEKDHGGTAEDEEERYREYALSYENYNKDGSLKDWSCLSDDERYEMMAKDPALYQALVKRWMMKLQSGGGTAAPENDMEKSLYMSMRNEWMRGFEDSREEIKKASAAEYAKKLALYREAAALECGRAAEELDDGRLERFADYCRSLRVNGLVSTKDELVNAMNAIRNDLMPDETEYEKRERKLNEEFVSVSGLRLKCSEAIGRIRSRLMDVLYSAGINDLEAHQYIRDDIESMIIMQQLENERLCLAEGNIESVFSGFEMKENYFFASGGSAEERVAAIIAGVYSGSLRSSFDCAAYGRVLDGSNIMPIIKELMSGETNGRYTSGNTLMAMRYIDRLLAWDRVDFTADNSMRRLIAEARLAEEIALQSDGKSAGLIAAEITAAVKERIKRLIAQKYSEENLSSLERERVSGVRRRLMEAVDSADKINEDMFGRKKTVSIESDAVTCSKEGNIRIRIKTAASPDQDGSRQIRDAEDIISAVYAGEPPADINAAARELLSSGRFGVLVLEASDSVSTMSSDTLNEQEIISRLKSDFIGEISERVLSCGEKEVNSMRELIRVLSVLMQRNYNESVRWDIRSVVDKWHETSSVAAAANTAKKIAAV